LLTHISIANYALIDALQTDFTEGLSIITGETGAGKSIVLGALGLVMGHRADLNSLKDVTKKCIIEATFAIEKYKLQAFFEKEDLDYEKDTIIRREILPSGKSRAFVNDTPVTLAVLTALKEQLIDVHSQHKTAQLSETSYQFKIVDALAQNEELLSSYKSELVRLKVLESELNTLLKEQETSKQAYAYNAHLCTELEEASLKEGEQEELETALEKMNNSEAISAALSESVHLATDEQVGLQSILHQVHSRLSGIATYAPEYDDFFKRVESLKIELDDVVFELEKASEAIEVNPAQLETYNDRLELLYQLQKKHGVATVSELLVVKEGLDQKVSQVENATEFLEQKEAAIAQVTQKLDGLAKRIHEARQKAIPKLSKQLKEVLTKLGMENANFNIELETIDTFNANGKDKLQFLFSANKGGQFDVLKKVASGGEMSRIMLGVKLILSKYSSLPTIIFDEIDTGVSGEVGHKIANIMQEMGVYMQVITITHLPQIAAKGTSHYKVYKKDIAGVTTTFLRKLNSEERIYEIAEILGGKNSTDAAIEHAKELLK